MKRLKFLFVLLLMGLVVLMEGLGWASAATQSGYSIHRHSVEGGVYTRSTGSNYHLGGTLGQHEDNQSSGGSYTLGGGMWPGGTPLPGQIYLPLVNR